MKIANIVYENELINHVKVEYINYINAPAAYDDIDKSLPTLYVGWSFMKECNLNNELIQSSDILDKTIINNKLYWEFSYKENKSQHISGVEAFFNYCPLYYFNPSYTYTNLDPIFFRLTNLDEILDVLPKSFDSMYVYLNQMIYVLKDNNIWGLNLELYSFFEFNVNGLIKTLSEKSKSVYLDEDGLIYESHLKKFPNFKQLKRHIVTMIAFKSS